LNRLATARQPNLLKAPTGRHLVCFVSSLWSFYQGSFQSDVVWTPLSALSR